MKKKLPVFVFVPKIQLCLTYFIHSVHCRVVLIYCLFILSQKKAQSNTEGPENQHASLSPVQFSSVAQSGWHSATPWITARQAYLSITNTRSLLKLTSIESVIPSSHLILRHPHVLLPPIPPSIRIFSNESSLHMRWPKFWSFSFSIIPSNEPLGLISFRWTGWISLQSKGLSRVFSNTTVQKHQFFSAQLSSQSNSHIHTWRSITQPLKRIHLNQF